MRTPKRDASGLHETETETPERTPDGGVPPLPGEALTPSPKPGEHGDDFSVLLYLSLL